MSSACEGCGIYRENRAAVRKGLRDLNEGELNGMVQYVLERGALKLKSGFHLVQDGPGKFVCCRLSAHVACPCGSGSPYISLPVQQRKTLEILILHSSFSTEREREESRTPRRMTLRKSR